MLKINKLTSDDIVAFTTATWIHLFNILFVIMSGLNPVELQVLVLVSSPVLGYLILKNRKCNEFDNIFLYSMVGFCCFVIVSVIFNHKPEVLIRIVNFIYLNTFIYFYLSIVKNGFIKLLNNYAYIGIAILLFLVFEIKGIEVRNDLDISPNYIGLIALTISLSALGFKRLTIKVLIFSLSFLLVMFVSSRAALLCLMVLISMDAYWVNKYGFLNLRSFNSRLVITLFIFFISLFLFFDIAVELFQLNDEYRGLGTGMSGRDIRWEAAYDAWLLNPIFGIGFGESSDYLGFTADNAFLTILVELGLIGFVFYSLLNIRALVSSFKYSFKIGFIFIIIYLLYGVFEKRYFGVGNSLSILYLFYLFSSFKTKKNIKKG